MSSRFDCRNAFYIIRLPDIVVVIAWKCPMTLETKCSPSRTAVISTADILAANMLFLEFKTA